MTPIDFHYFLWALIFIVQSLLPVAGLLVIALKVKVGNGFLRFLKFMIPIIGILYFVIGMIPSPGFPCHDLYLFYSLVISLFLHFFQARNPEKPTKVLGISLMVSHLFSQYWEIPIFIAGHLNILGAKYLGSIDQLYLILVFCIAIKYAGISIDGHVILDLLTPLFFSALALYLMPIGNPQMPQGWFVRGISCLFLGKVFIERSVL